MLSDIVQKMILAPQKSIGMDVLIISTGTLQQEDYWQKRLMELRGYLVKPETLIATVYEDWEGGAGNALGTLFAYQKARDKILRLYGEDIYQKQNEGATIAIYHSAGQGARLFPITASEYNNKSAVKLPGLAVPENSSELLSILEAVIKQTAIYAPSRKGRLSVFWGDQVFIPYHRSEYLPDSHIDILVKHLDTPAQDQWIAQGLDNYGMIAFDKSGMPFDLDKIDYKTFKKLIDSKLISADQGIAISLGSFSLSPAMTFALLQEFKEELHQRKGKFDCEPFIWMPTTLDKNVYLDLMDKRKYASEEASRNYDRMQTFKEKFCSQNKSLKFFNSVDIGKNSLWWDFGNIGSYYSNMMKLTERSMEANAMRQFFQISQNTPSTEESPLKIDQNSCLLNCQIKAGNVKNSVLVGVTSDFIEISDSIVINASIKSLKCRGCFLYNVLETEPLFLEYNTVRADTFLPPDNQHYKVYTQKNRDGKADWNIQIPPNRISYEELYQLIRTSSKDQKEER